mgnify:FL=1
MLTDANFLCEIGTEEIPAGYIPPAAEAIKKTFVEKFQENRIAFSAVDILATPRRLTVLASGVSETQSEEEAELKGPSAKAAYDAQGNPTKALEGFLKGNHLTEKDVYRQNTEKGEYVFARKKLESGKTESILPAIIEHAVSTLPFPKRMKWSDKKITFPRPIRYFLTLFNDRPVSFQIAGIASGSIARGHFEIGRASCRERV